MSLRRLSMKTAFLVALVCYKRPADLCNMQVDKDFWQLDMRGFTCKPLRYGKTEAHSPVPPIRIEPFLKDPRLCPVYHLVRLERMPWLPSDGVVTPARLSEGAIRQTPRAAAAMTTARSRAQTGGVRPAVAA